MDEKFTKGPWGIDTVTRPAEICTIYGLPSLPTEDGLGQQRAYVRGPID